MQGIERLYHRAPVVFLNNLHGINACVQLRVLSALHVLVYPVAIVLQCV